MPENDRIVIKRILDENNKEIAPDISVNDYFEIFAAEQVLKEYDLSYEEIKSGLVGGGNDGGIDSIHLLVNGSVIQEDTDISNLGREIKIELYIVQSKLETGFNEATIQKFGTTTNDIFDLSKPLDVFEGIYNENLIRVVSKFREVYEFYATRLPKLIIKFFYVTIGDKAHPNVKRLVSTLRDIVFRLFSSAEFSFGFIGAADLLVLARQTPVNSFNLRIAENPISSGEQSFVCLVNIVEYYNFICDSEGHLNRRIFEANVRDYQGNVQVNLGIMETLSGHQDEEFWWLNNGITMIATRASHSGKTLTIENPLVVNGMQTSYEIYKYFSGIADREDQRNILIRVIGVSETPDELEIRNRIIKATNSQTAIQIASLRATGMIQRDIEDFLRSEGFYYDRRKNYYKNERKPIEKIVSITYLAQSVISLVLRRPNDARARPSTLLRDDEDYQSIFNPEYPMPLYLKCVQILRYIESYLRDTFSGITYTEINNYKFHLAMFSALLSVNNPTSTIDELLGIDLDNMTTEFLNSCHKEVT